MKCFFPLEHLASLFFFSNRKILKLICYFFHGCFRVYRIEVGNETLIAKKVVIVKIQQLKSVNKVVTCHALARQFRRCFFVSLSTSK